MAALAEIRTKPEAGSSEIATRVVSYLRVSVRAGREPLRGVVVARYDRLSRDTFEALAIERAFARTGAEVVFAEGLNGSEYSFMRTIMFALAEEDRRRLLGRMADGKRAKAAQGGYTGGRPPFGYEGRGGLLRPREEEAELVRHIFRRVADGESLRKIAADLDQRRAAHRRWFASHLSAILRRDLYKTGPAEQRIVDPRVWNRANAVVADRRPRSDTSSSSNGG
jgi:hypothetical protein